MNEGKSLGNSSVNKHRYIILETYAIYESFKRVEHFAMYDINVIIQSSNYSYVRRKSLRAWQN